MEGLVLQECGPPGHCPVTGRNGPEHTDAREEVKQTSARLNYPAPSHTCKELCSAIFSLTVRGKLSLSMGVGGTVTATAQG